MLKHIHTYNNYTAGGMVLVRQFSSHWLDRYESLQTWLHMNTTRWWIQGLVNARCRDNHELQGREVELKRALEEEYRKNVKKHSSKFSDSRSRLHVSVASLVLSTHKCLMAYLRDEARVMKIISEHMGSSTAPALEYV